VIFRWDSPLRLMWAGVKSACVRFIGLRTLTTVKERDSRLDICDGCEEQTDDGQCRVCTCFTLAKASLTMEKCPLGKWGRVWQKRRKFPLLR